MSKLIKSTDKTILVMFAAVSLLVLASCSSVQKGSNEIKSMAVKPAADTDFIEHSGRQIKRADLPFQKVWIKEGFEKSNYQELIVAPVNTEYMLEMDWLHKASSASWVSDVKEDIKELGNYFHDQVVKEFKEDVNHRFQVIGYPIQVGQPVLRLELALIEIDPSTPVLHALSWASPVPGVGTTVGLINQRRAAFEGRLRDLRTGEVVATFADRDTADAGPLDLTRLTWYGPARGIMDRWAKQFVAIANAKPGEAVTDPIAYTLRPF
jgi:hypothetical protein